MFDFVNGLIIALKEIFKPKKTINYLLQINAIKLNTKNPFTWASGIKSPIYCDNRLILSNTEVRSYIADQMSDIIRKSFSDNYILAGVATGAIAIGALVAERLKKPYIYVRPTRTILLVGIFTPAIRAIILR